MKKILFVLGTRPEAIKMAPLIHRFYDESGVEPLICLSAQHRTMLDEVLTAFDLRADYDLDIMKPAQSLYDITARVLVGLKSVLETAAPDMVFVHGDTTTGFAAALAAFYARLPIAHIEAGLRTHDLSAPYPEEANRRLIAQLVNLHYTPTQTGADNLRAENVPAAQIIITGNTVIDALLMMQNKLARDNALNTKVRDGLTQAGFCPSSPATASRRLILVTAHRRENWGEGIRDICAALRTIATRNPDCDIVYPVHLNPAIKDIVQAELADCENIYLIAPQPYTHFVYLMSHAHIVLTDSGGIQEEAPGLGKPVLVMRDVTERPEAVREGTVLLVGTKRDAIIGHVQTLLDDAAAYDKMSRAHNPYGDGKACARIAEHLKTYW